MTNGEIAGVFDRISAILSLQGENPFRIRAYERAALTIRALPEDLAAIHARGGTKALKEIGGIGDDLAAKIEELVTTGKLTYVEKLEKKVPPGVLTLLGIPGLGPKKVHMLWKKFRVKDLGDLQKILDSGKLLKVQGWGEKSIENVRRGMLIRETVAARMPISVALPIAEAIVEKLRASKLCEQVAIAGSMRRGRETVGDIDILVTAVHPEKVMDVFCSMTDVTSLIARGATKSSVRLSSGMQADLRVVEPDVFGAALHYFTGSKEHNMRLRSMAIDRRITVSEYGVFRGTAKKKGTRLASQTEEDIFAALDLPYIPPEIREDRGEIEAAQKGTLPRLIEEKDLHGDLHMHSTFSDGSASMVAMAKAAKERGFSYIAITDHASRMGMVKGIKDTNIAKYLSMVRAAEKEISGMHILAGAEVDIEEDGSLYLSDRTLGKLDWVVASIHSHFTLSPEKQTVRLLRAIEHPCVHVIGHLTGRLLGKRPPITFDVAAVFAAAKKHGVALELNASVERLDLDDVMCRRAKDMSIPILIDSDAHHTCDLQYRYGIVQARRGWIEKGDVLNTRSWAEFQKWLKRR